MKKLYILCLTILISVASFGQTTVFQETFETDGNGDRYTTSITEYSDGGGDFFGRTNLNNTAEDPADLIVGTYYTVSDTDGTFCFAAMDLDAANASGSGGSSTQTLVFQNIDISTYTDLTLAILAAEDDDGSTNQDWDSDSLVYVEVNIDGAGYIKVLQFASQGATNTEPGLDTDFDGIRDGAALTSAFQEFTFDLGTGSSADIRITFDKLDAGDEDIAIDNIRIIDGYVPPVTSPTLTLQDAPPSGTVDTTSPEETQQQLQFVVTNFNVAVPPAGDGYIMWEVINNGTVIISGNEQDLSDPVVLPELTQGETYTLNAKLVDNAGADLVPAVEYTLTTTVETYTQVTDLAGLRAGTIGKYYHVTNEVIAVWAQAFDNQKWAQDGSAGIIITDFDGIITTVYNEGDGVTGIKGQLDEFNGLLELIPTVDPGVATSTGNPVIAQSVTIADLLNDHEPYESQLVEIADVVFADANGVATFATNTNYNISDSSSAVAKSNASSKTSAGPIAFSTYLIRNPDYIGQIIPSGPQTIKAIVGEYNGAVQIASRNMTTDLILSVEENNIEGFGIYPNPVANGEFRIKTASNEVKQVSIFNILGKQVYNKIVKANEAVNVENLTTGIYFVNVVEDGKTATKKLVIK